MCKNNRKHLRHRKECRFPKMEKRLHEWIIEQRKDGIPIDTAILKVEATEILSETNPNESFKFSYDWMKGFFNRKHLSIRKKTSRQRMKPLECERLCKYFHRKVTLNQMSGDVCSVYGSAHAYCVFNDDEVPIEFADQGEKTNVFFRLSSSFSRLNDKQDAKAGAD